MKGLRSVISVVLLSLFPFSSAFAAGTKVYNSGILVLVFLGFCALVVVAQLLPAIITLWGMLKSVASGERNKETVTEHVE